LDEKLDHETETTLHAYLLTFSGSYGQKVLDDLRRSYFDRPFDESRFDDHAYLVARATEHNMYLKIVRLRQRAAERVQTLEGVEPSRTPEVIIE
jgi:hypothetical protein